MHLPFSKLTFMKLYKLFRLHESGRDLKLNRIHFPQLFEKGKCPIFENYYCLTWNVRPA